MVSIRHLQKHQPWSIEYSEEFLKSKEQNIMRQVSHDILHVMKGLGRLAAECEYADHGKPGKLTEYEFASNLSDLVQCAMHIATLVGIDLETMVLEEMERRNNVKISPETNECQHNYRTETISGVWISICSKCRRVM